MPQVLHCQLPLEDAVQNEVSQVTLQPQVWGVVCHAGSAQHAFGNCRPCLWFHKSTGCSSLDRNGTAWVRHKKARIYIYIYIHSQVGLVVCVGVFSPIGPMGLEYGMFCLGDTSATYSLKLHVQIPAGEALQHSTTNNIE